MLIKRENEKNGEGKGINAYCPGKTLQWRRVAPNTVQAISRIVIDRAVQHPFRIRISVAFEVLNEYEYHDGRAVELQFAGGRTHGLRRWRGIPVGHFELYCMEILEAHEETEELENAG